MEQQNNEALEQDTANGAVESEEVSAVSDKGGKPRKSKKPKEERFGTGRTVAVILCTPFLVLATIALFAAVWYINVYGNTGFDSIIFTLTNELGGVDNGIITDVIFKVILPSILCSAAVIVGLFLKLKKNLTVKTAKKKEWVIYPFKTDVSALISAVLTFSLIFTAAETAGLTDYVISRSQKTVLFTDKDGIYVDPYYAEITFPEEKQNLIIIYLESMETTFMTAENSGGHSEDLTTELHALARDNLNFSHNDAVGGAQVLTGGSWTIGALVSMNAGVPLKTPSGEQNDYGKDTFLPGIYTLSDILHENGYYQTMMVGSDGMFGGRKTFYEQHGTDYMYDLFTARSEGIVPTSDYWDGWWGMEDIYLFEYAKQELTEIASKDQPFAFSMLTVDTHAWGGHLCELCGSDHSEKYDNVWKCSSKQVSEFVSWIQDQEWYENTTIVLTGDHLTMDNDYVNRTIESGFDRRIYNCFINTVGETDNYKNRDFCTLDMFPTFLGAIGCEIEGDRLGLGTNLFSETETLCEELTAAKLDTELQKSSDQYERFYIPRDKWEANGFGHLLAETAEDITETTIVTTEVEDPDFGDGAGSKKFLFTAVYIALVALSFVIFFLYRFIRARKSLK